MGWGPNRYALDVEHIYSLVPNDTPPGLFPMALECCRLMPSDRPDMKAVIERLQEIETKLPGLPSTAHKSLFSLLSLSLGVCESGESSVFSLA